LRPNQISLWKKQAIESLPEIFERPNKKTETERESEEKYDDALKTLGMMKIENEFLKKKYKQLYECQALGISRSVAYYARERMVQDRDLVILEKIRDVLEQLPFYGYRKVSREIRKKYFPVTEKQVRRIMARAGLQAIFPAWRKDYPVSESGMGNRLDVYQASFRPCVSDGHYRSVFKKSP